MQIAPEMVVLMILAAGLEVGGIAAIRRGLLDGAGSWVLLGAAALVGYGLVLNGNRALEFGRMMGFYIALFFVVSQMLSFALFAERPTGGLMVGGALIVAGAVVIQMTAR
jgi:drug/metabolite transporter superfamily protein YnfA